MIPTRAGTGWRLSMTGVSNFTTIMDPTLKQDGQGFILTFLLSLFLGAGNRDSSAGGVEMAHSCFASNPLH